MNENFACGDCLLVATNYEKHLDDQKRELITFRGHGQKKYKEQFSSFLKKAPYTNEEIKIIIKLIILGTKKLFYIQKNEKINVTYGGLKIASELQNDEERYNFILISKIIRRNQVVGHH